MVKSTIPVQLDARLPTAASDFLQHVRMDPILAQRPLDGIGGSSLGSWPTGHHGGGIFPRRAGRQKLWNTLEWLS